MAKELQQGRLYKQSGMAPHYVALDGGDCPVDDRSRVKPEDIEAGRMVEGFISLRTGMFLIERIVKG